MRRHAAFDSVVRFTPISPRRKLSARRKLLMGLTAAFVLLLALEGVARIVKTIHDDTIVDERDWYVYSAQVGWKPRPHAFDMPYECRRYFDGGGYFVEDTKKIWDQSGRPRVIGVGDSTMYGYGVATRDTYLERLQERLPQADFINLAIPGYSSCNGSWRLVYDAMPLRPSLILASFNFNDRRYVLSPADVDSPAHFAALVRRQTLVNVTRRIYLLRGMYWALRKTHVLAQRDDPGRLDMLADYVKASRVDLGTLKVRVEPDRYRENLERMIGVARGAKVPIVFIMTGDNVAWTAPIREGLKKKAAGDLEGAIQALAPAVALNNAFSPEARVELARVYEAAGDAQKARQARLDDRPFNSLLGGYTLYRDDEYQAIMLDVAAKNGVPVVDARLADHPEVFMDFCHFDARGHAIVAELIERTLRQKGLIPQAVR